MAASVYPRLPEPIHGLKLIQPGNTVVPLQLIMPGEAVVPLQQGQRALLLIQESNFENLNLLRSDEGKASTFYLIFLRIPDVLIRIRSSLSIGLRI